MLLMKLLFCLFVSLVAAQRPADASICDYYAAQLYGTNTSVTQITLVKHIMSLAFAGRGNLTLPNLSVNFTGIMQYYAPQNLQGFFNGSMPVTNINGMPGSINWLDGAVSNGSDFLAPAHDYLEGRASDVIFSEDSNEFLLFDHFFVTFSKLFGCSNPPGWAIGPTNPPNPAYVHKYMNLTQDKLVRFIDTVTQASIVYGFSAQDAQQLNATWNNMFNVRCSAAQPLYKGQAPQLLSLCQNPTCPLPIDGSANCSAYTDLTQIGAGIDADASIVINSGAPPVTSSSASSATASPTSTTNPIARSSSSSSFGTGAIVGVVIGALALLFFTAAAFFLVRRRRQHEDPSELSADKSEEEKSEKSSPVAATEMDSQTIRSAGPDTPKIDNTPRSPGLSGEMPGSPGHRYENDTVHSVNPVEPVEIGEGRRPESGLFGRINGAV